MSTLHSKKKTTFVDKIKNFCIPCKGDSHKKRIGKLISLFAFIALVFCLIASIFIIIRYQKPKSVATNYDSLLPSSTPIEDEKTPKKTITIDPKTGVNADLAKLYETNNQTVGYLSIENSKLAYPIPRGTDNLFYLDHTLFKEYDPFGVPFADYRSTIKKEIDPITGLNAQSDNITIYGHSAKDGTFFDAVKKYKDLDYYKEHPLVEFKTIYGDSKYKVIGLFMENVNIKANPSFFAYHDFVDKQSDQDLLSFVDNVKKRSYFTTSVDILPTDQLITLSTCDLEVNKNDYRVALVARRVRLGEDEAVDVNAAQENKEMIMPDGWIKKKNRKNPFVK